MGGFLLFLMVLGCSCLRRDHTAFRRSCSVPEPKTLPTLHRLYTGWGRVPRFQTISTCLGLLLLPVEDSCSEHSDFEFFWEWGGGYINKEVSPACFVGCELLILISGPFIKDGRPDIDVW